jgi:GT2 family glycosyltransferase
MPDIDCSVPPNLSVSVVLYRNAPAQLTRFRDALLAAVAPLQASAAASRVTLTVIDNAAHEGDTAMQRVFVNMPGFDAVRCIPSERNLGYGRAHNRALHQAADVHLILNPDVYLAPDALLEGMRYLQAHPDVGWVSPYGENDDGTPLFLSKRYPSVLDLLLRGFAPRWLRRVFDKRLARYEMREAYTGNTPVEDVEIASGCCMLVRAPLLQRVGGFCEAYFLYFEDFDLSMQVRQHARIAFLPSMRIVHEGGHAARKGWRHVKWFAASGCRFFRRHGWRLF